MTEGRIPCQVIGCNDGTGSPRDGTQWLVVHGTDVPPAPSGLWVCDVHAADPAHDDGAVEA